MNEKPSTINTQPSTKPSSPRNGNISCQTNDFSDITSNSSLSDNFQTLNYGKLTNRLCCLCRIFSFREICKCLCTFLLCCPCIVIVSFVVLGISMLFSYFHGRTLLRDSHRSSSGFFAKYIQEHIEHAKLTTEVLSISLQAKSIVCKPYSQQIQDDADQFLLSFVRRNEFHVHHARIIRANGSECSRIDLEHSNFAYISPSKFDVSSKSYHKRYLEGLSQSEPYCGSWSTHGPLQFGEYYDFYGEDLDGDHVFNHVEYLPLPQIIRIQKSVMCNESFSGGYVILNLRMVILLKEIESSYEGTTLLIINEKGEYIFHSSNRGKEFQKDLGKKLTLETDWSPGVTNIRERLFQKLEKEFTIGTHEFLCNMITLSSDNYQVCLVVGTLNSFSKSPIPIVIGIFLIFILLGLIICCFVGISLWVQSNSRKYGELVGSLYPREVSKPLLRGKKVIARYEQNICIVFADIVRFVELNDNFQNDPNVLIIVLGNLIDVIDACASLYNVYKIKTIGDCYFGVSGLQFGKKLSNEKQNKLNACNIQRVIRFCCLFIRFFETRSIVIPSKNLEIECPNFRVGIAFGGAVSGIINRKTPYFDLWGKSVNLAARMESSGKPGKVQISKTAYDVLKMDSSTSRTFEFLEREPFLVKGFGFSIAYFVQMKSKQKLDETLHKACKSVLKKFSKKFIKRVESGENNNNKNNNDSNRNNLFEDHLNKKRKKRKGSSFELSIIKRGDSEVEVISHVKEDDDYYDCDEIETVTGNSSNCSSVSEEDILLPSRDKRQEKQLIVCETVKTEDLKDDKSDISDDVVTFSEPANMNVKFKMIKMN